MSGVQSVERAFAILRCLAGGPAGVSELAERVALPKSTVSRLLSTLQGVGAVEQSSAGTEYRIGAGVVDLTAGAHHGRDLVAVARPHLAELVETLDEVAGLSVLDLREVVYLDQVAADHQVQMRDWTGERIPADQTSSGLALLAAMSDGERDRWLAGPMAPLPDGSAVDVARLRRRLRKSAPDGFAWAIDEFIPGVASVAAPITAPDGVAIAAVHVHGPSYRFPRPDGADEIARVVVGAARRISERLAARSDALAS